MLLNTHTWLLKEYAGDRLQRDNLDIFIYNVIKMSRLSRCR